jgi:hypothetical protein
VANELFAPPGIVLNPPQIGGSGDGTVTSVTAADTSIVVGGTAAAPTIKTATLDVIAADHPAAADWSNNSHKITNLANGTNAQDAATFGQIASILGLVTGRIKGSDGSTLAGTKFSCVRNSAGNYTVTFSPTLGAVPALSYGLVPSGGSAGIIISTSSVATTGFNFFIYSSTFVATDCDWTFTTITII